MRERNPAASRLVEDASEKNQGGLYGTEEGEHNFEGFFEEHWEKVPDRKKMLFLILSTGGCKPSYN